MNRWTRDVAVASIALAVGYFIFSPAPRQTGDRVRKPLLDDGWLTPGTSDEHPLCLAAMRPSGTRMTARAGPTARSGLVVPLEWGWQE